MGYECGCGFGWSGARTSGGPAPKDDGPCGGTMRDTPTPTAEVTPVGNSAAESDEAADKGEEDDDVELGATGGTMRATTSRRRAVRWLR